MTKGNIDKESIINKAVELVNSVGIDKVTLKMLAENLGIKSPSLYNHIDGVDDLKMQLMMYGWKQAEERITQAVIGLSGFDAIRAMCYAFYDYVIENPGVFIVMLWYNKFESGEMEKATAQLLAIIFKITNSLNIPEDYCFHLIRTFRSFLEGYFLLVNNGSFGHSLPLSDSFEISIEILIAGIQSLMPEWNKVDSIRTTEGASQ